MNTKWETYFKVKVFTALTILFMSPIDIKAQDKIEMDIINTKNNRLIPIV